MFEGLSQTQQVKEPSLYRLSLGELRYHQIYWRKLLLWTFPRKEISRNLAIIWRDINLLLILYVCMGLPARKSFLQSDQASSCGGSRMLIKNAEAYVESTTARLHIYPWVGYFTSLGVGTRQKWPTTHGVDILRKIHRYTVSNVESEVFTPNSCLVWTGIELGVIIIGDLPVA